jgi:hypothetical protein
MSYWTLPEGSVAGELTCVLRPDGVIGDAAWMETVEDVNDRRNEKTNLRQRIGHTYPACCWSKADLLSGQVALPRQTPINRAAEWNQF